MIRGNLQQFLLALVVFQFQIAVGSDAPSSLDRFETKQLIVEFKDTDNSDVSRIIREVRNGETLRSDPRAILLGDVVVSVHRFLPIARNASPDSSRGRLSNHLVVEYQSREHARSAWLAMTGNSLVRSVSVNQPISGLSSAENCYAEPCGPESFGSISKTWGFHNIQASSGRQVSQGHALVSVVDTGIDPDHVAFKAFQSGSYVDGNLRQSISYSFREAVPSNPPSSDPIFEHGVVILEDIDEYKYEIHPVVDSGTLAEQCDSLMEGGNNNGFAETAYAGHGSHVSGILAAKQTASGFPYGVCEACSLKVVRFFFSPESGHCWGGNPDIHPITGAHGEFFPTASILSMFASIAWSADTGAQIINLSGGIPLCELNLSESTDIGYPGSCQDQSFADNYKCLVLEYLDDAEVLLVASGGNEDQDGLDFPASDPSVIGVSGSMYLHQPSSVYLWQESADYCGSNIGTLGQADYWPDVAAPARAVYSTMYPNVDYSYDNRCFVGNDGDASNGYGYCTGTSMSAPFVSGVLGLVRSVNPLATRNEARQALNSTASRSLSGLSQVRTLGHGVPRAGRAAEEMLGVVGGVKVMNRVAPLFSIVDNSGDYALTSKPQIAVAYLRTLEADDYGTDSGAGLIHGYSYPSGISDQPQADAFVLTTHEVPFSSPGVKPIFRMRKLGSSSWDTVLVASNSEINSFHSNGYDLEAKEGYIFNVCSPTPSCIPDGAVPLYRAFNSSTQKHAMFVGTRASEFSNAGFTSGLTLLGYAYGNMDSDGDGLIDGLEYLIGTDPQSADSNCDGVADSVYYPPWGLPQGDPLLGNQC